MERTWQAPAGRDGEKWAAATDGVLPAWVADMDFPVAPAVRAAIVRRADTDLGYPAWYDESGGGPLGPVFAERMRRRHGFAAEAGHVRLFTDINQAMQVVLHLGTDRGDPVAVHAPCCPPFVDTLGKLRRPPRPVPLCRADGRWQVDRDQFVHTVRGSAATPPCKAFFLVNPHNPTGKVFSRDELWELAELALEHDLLVISDEVHAELTYPPHRHVPFASLAPEVAARTVTVTSGSKAFNLAGVRCAVAHIGPARIREAVDAHHGILFGQVSAFGVDALRAAWTDADTWLDEVRAVLRRNRTLVLEGLPAGVDLAPPAATSLAWLDCRALGIGDDPAAFFLDHAKVLLFRGTEFGPEGAGFARLNFATSTDLLVEILRRMGAAVAAQNR